MSGPTPDTPPNHQLSYAQTVPPGWRRWVVHLLEFTTAKPALLRLVRRFRREGIPTGPAFFPAILRVMGVSVEIDREAQARIPREGPLVVVANHPRGLIDGIVVADMLGEVRQDYKILSRRILRAVRPIAELSIPVPFPHEPDAREAAVAMRRAALAQLREGGAVIVFPAGEIAGALSPWGAAVEGDWHVFTAKLIRESGATVVPVALPGQASRSYLIAGRLSRTLRQGLLLREIKLVLKRPQRAVIGTPLAPDDPLLQGPLTEMPDPQYVMVGEGYRIATYSWGDPDAETVLAVHGFSSSAPR